jgi:hypothetical protein
LTGGVTVTVPRLRFNTAGGSWWSMEMFHLNGFAAAEDVPSTDLMR